MPLTHRPLTTLALALSLFMAALELTVVSTAMPTVVSDLGGIQHFAWVFNAYMLAGTITVPIYGKLADLYGRKPILLFGIALFVCGSLASGFATSMGALIAFRVLQGLGAGAIQPIALTVIGDIFNLEERARVQGAFSGVWGFAGLVGPYTGGLVVKYLSWHWVFFLNVPVGILTAALLVFAFHENIQRQRRSLDIAGAVLLAVGLVALLFGVQGRDLRPLPLAGAALVAFAWVESRVREPLMPLALFRIPAIAISSTAGAMFSGAMFGATAFVPLYVQGVLGGSPTDAGALITPMIVAWPLCSLAGGRLIPRVGFRPLIVGGLALAALSNVLMAALLTPGSSLFVAKVSMGLFGAGLGFASTALLIAVQTSVGWELRGVATASNMFFRTIGGALGVGVMGSVLVAHLSADPRVPIESVNNLIGPGHGHAISAELTGVLGAALQQGLTSIFWIMTAFSAAAFIAGLFFPRVARKEEPPEQGMAEGLGP